MIRAKNYETASKFVKVMPRMLRPLFFRTRRTMRNDIHIYMIYQGAANKSNPLPCFVNISTTNRNF